MSHFNLRTRIVIGRWEVMEAVRFGVATFHSHLQ
jgi:hypothetical protein